MGQFRIANRAVMMLRLPAMQLHEQLAIRNQLLVMASTVAALASQKTLVPATARFNISNTNERLWTHWQLNSSSTTAPSRMIPWRRRTAKPPAHRAGRPPAASVRPSHAAFVFRVSDDTLKTRSTHAEDSLTERVCSVA